MNFKKIYGFYGSILTPGKLTTSEPLFWLRNKKQGVKLLKVFVLQSDSRDMRVILILSRELIPF